MFLAQAEPVVHEVIIQSGTPWHIYIAAFVATVVAIGGWFFVHRTSQSRDLKNWRRTTLLESVAKMVESSISRRDHIQASIGNYDRFTIKRGYKLPEAAREAQRKMLSARYQIQICIADDVLLFADAIIKLHQNSSIAIERLQRSYMEDDDHVFRNMTPEQIIKNEKVAEIDTARLDYNHREIIKALQVEIQLAKYDHNPGHAQVIYGQPYENRMKFLRRRKQTGKLATAVVSDQT